MNKPRNNPKDSTNPRWRRWSKRTTEEIGRPLSVADTFSGLMDIRSLVGAPPASVYDTGSGVITLSGRLPPAPAAVPPLTLYQHRQQRSDWKIGIAAVVLAGLVVAILASAVIVRSAGEGSAPEAAPPAPGAIAERSAAPSPGPAMPAATASVASRDETDEPAVAEPVAKAPKRPTPTTVERRTETAELDELLGGSRAKPKARHQRKHRHRAEKPAATAVANEGPRPQTLSRAQVKAGMGPVAGQVKRCAKGRSGLVVMDVAISGSGRVVRAYATGALAGTATGKCAAKAVRRARFPEFSGPKITVKYPFRL